LSAQNEYTPADYRHRDRVAVRRALISVSDKTGLIELATALAEAGVSIVSTGSTASSIRSAGIEVTEVVEVTGFAEALGACEDTSPKDSRRSSCRLASSESRGATTQSRDRTF